MLTSSSSRFCEVFQPLWQISKTFSQCLYAVAIFLFLVSVESGVWFPNTRMLVLKRRVVAGRDEESSDVSCGDDVGDVLALELEEPVANPGTTICA